ncbi:uncharacterized protein DUF4884 [Dysgonomonas alginatilytica]|uniref:Uncharacterized protein DUF4884 n=1 Tax=Dysgonomonas alginatilytica TaxID=1605892 RepID=A0A2V3PP72_9BACT|nr:DUF4884 domain-containing protein [Dysgonomonas alginatilytica]PXV64084.1 uncharacterized protein DUF4884 [Dysgonomonas alginatilytica]
MKTFIILLIGISLLSFSSCGSNEPLVRTKAQNNATYEVDYLFEHDGCKVYRFLDNHKYVYFTNCTGDVTVSNNDSTNTQIQTIIRNR